MLKEKNLILITGAVIVVLVVVLVLNVTGVLNLGRQEVASPYRTDRIVIGLALPDITGVYKTATDFFLEAAADARMNGVHVEVIPRSVRTHTAYADQVAIIEDFIATGVDVLAISPTDVPAVTPALIKVNEAGIPIVVINLLTPIEGVEAVYVGFSNKETGMVSAYSVLDYLGGPGVLGTGEKVTVSPTDFLDLAWWEALYADVDRESISGKGVWLEGVAGSYFSNARLEGFAEVMAEWPNVEQLVPPIPTDWNRAKAMAAAEDVLTRFGPGEIDFIWSMSSEMGLGAMLGVEAKGRQEDVVVINQGGTAESMSRTREGRLLAETWHGFPEWGWYGVRFAVMMALGLGDEVPMQFDVRPRTIYVDNLIQVSPIPYLSAHDWEGILERAGK